MLTLEAIKEGAGVASRKIAELFFDEHRTKPQESNQRDLQRVLMCFAANSDDPAHRKPDVQSVTCNPDVFNEPKDVNKPRCKSRRNSPRLDRYERRALSRRKFAIRELDALRAQANR